MSYTITVKNEDIHKIKIEPFNEFEKSYFSQTYHQAWDAIINIHENQPDSKNSDKADSDRGEDTRYKYHVTTNNVILFSGERGSGKSSAMASFANALEHNTENLINHFRDKQKKRSPGPLKFKVMDIIDPSYFTPKRNLLYVFVSNLFKEFKKIAAEEPHTVNRNFDPVLRLFSRTFKAIQHLDLDFASQAHSDAIERLDDLSESLELDTLFGKLIQQFMELYFSKGRPRDADRGLVGKYIVVPIDDLDMCVDHAFELLEQTRKFLIQNHVIILMAANLDQLKLELEEHYLKSFRLKKEHTADSSSTGNLSEIEEMTSRYLGKIVPPSRRLNVSHIDIDFMDTYLYISNPDENDGGKKKENKSKNKDDKENSPPPREDLLQNKILRLIWEKTGLIFIPEENQLHAIVPDNLRALHQLIYLLNNMKETKLEKLNKNGEQVNDEEDKGASIEENFYSFKNYIMNYWIPFHLSSEEQDVFANLPLNIVRINKYLIQSINYIGNLYKKKIVIKDVDLKLIYGDKKRKSPVDRDIYTMVSVNDPKFMEANKISDPFNHPSNNSMGDILLLIDKYEVYFESRKAVTFISAVKIFYSLLLFEQIFIKSYIHYKDYPIVSHLENKQDEVSGKELKLDDTEILPIQLLIGGTTYYPHYFELFDSTKSSFYEIVRDEEFEKNSDAFKKEEKRLEKENEGVKDINEWIRKENIKLRRQNKQLIKKEEERSPEELQITIKERISEMKKGIETKLKKRMKDYEYYFPTLLRCLSDDSTTDLLAYFALYYGENRPERPFRKHIYDTTCLDGERAEKDGLYVARFDVLAPLVNMLNPIHTFLRSSRECWSFEKCGDFTCSILKWLRENPIIETIDGQDDSSQKIRLKTYFPLYSVDVMLELLRIRHDEIDEIEKDPKQPKKISFKDSTLMSNAWKYLKKLEDKCLDRVKEHLGEKASNYLSIQLKNNPMRIHLDNAAGEEPQIIDEQAGQNARTAFDALELYPRTFDDSDKPDE